MNVKKLYKTSWTIPSPKAHCLIIHGYGEHIDRYHHIAKELNNIGFSVYGFDLRGHGKSEGMKGYINNFDEYIFDTLSVINDLKDQGIKITFILAHSMGGLILSNLLISKKIQPTSVVFSSPMLIPDPGVPKILIALSSIISTLLPKIRTIKIDTLKIATDKETVNKYQTDPLVLHKGIPARTGKSFLDEMARVRAEIAKISLPFFVITGTDDEVVNPAGAKYLFDHATSEEKQFLPYPSMYHELMNETIKDQVLNDITNWFKKYLN